MDAKTIAGLCYNRLCGVASDLDSLATQLAHEGRAQEIQVIRELYCAAHESMQRIRGLAFPEIFPRELQPGDLMHVRLSVDLERKACAPAAGGES